MDNLLDVGGIKVRILAQTAALDLFEFSIDRAGQGPGLHQHRSMTEMFYLVSGNVDFTIGERSFTASPGEFHAVAPHTTHSWNSCGPAKMLVQFSPSQDQVGYFCHLAELYEQNVPWGEAIASLADRFDNHPA